MIPEITAVMMTAEIPEITAATMTAAIPEITAVMKMAPGNKNHKVNA